MRVNITLECTSCKERNYLTSKNKRNNPDRLEKQWIVKSKGAKKASNHFDTKKEAIEKGKQVAQNKQSTLIIYKKDGTKEKEISY